MTNKQLDTLRETRLWMAQIVIPIVGVAMMVPEARKAVTDHIKRAKVNIETLFKKNKGGA